MKLPDSLELHGPRLKFVNGAHSNFQEIQKILNDEITMQYLQFLMRKNEGGWTLDPLIERHQKRREKQAEGVGLFFDVYEIATSRFVGTAGFPSLELDHRRGEFGLILNRNFWRNGFGTQCHLIGLSYAFETLNLNRVEFLTSIKNTPLRKFYDKVGIAQESIRKQYYLENGGFVDFVVYATFQREWETLKTKLSARGQ